MHNNLFIGCDTGFGHLTALQLNSTGFTVFAGCYDPNGEGVSRLKKNVSDSSRLHVIPLDVTKDESVSSAVQTVKTILEKDGSLKLFGLVNNAGILRAGQFEWGSLDYMVKDVMEVNTMGVARVTKSFLPLIREAEGRIVNINSTASRYAVPSLVSYCMAKHASLALTEGLRREVKKFRVKVISVEPYIYGTRMAGKDVIDGLLDEAFNSSSDEVKSAYGSKFYEYMKKVAVHAGANLGSKAVDDVSLSVVDALTSAEPELRYNCCLWYMKPLIWAGLHICPTEIFEILTQRSLMSCKLGKCYPD